MNNQHQPIESVDLSTLPQMDGRPVATAKQLSELSGRALSQVYATVRIGATKKIPGTTLFDAETYFAYMRTRRVGRPSLETKLETQPDQAQ